MRALAAEHATLLQLTGAGTGETGGAGEISAVAPALVDGAVLMDKAPLAESLPVTMEGFCRMGMVIVFCGRVVRVMTGLGKVGKVGNVGLGKDGSVMVGRVIVPIVKEGFGMTGIVNVGLKFKRRDKAEGIVSAATMSISVKEESSLVEGTRAGASG